MTTTRQRPRKNTAGTARVCLRCGAAWSMPPDAPPPAFCPACGRRDWAVDPHRPKLEIVPRSGKAALSV